MNKSVKSTLVLLCICAAMAILLAVTNSITSPIIAENQAAAANQALLEVMPNGKDFQSVDLSSYTLPATVKENQIDVPLFRMLCSSLIIDSVSLSPAWSMM